MSSLSALKALVTVAALGLGVGTAVMVVGIQRDPLKFTSMDRRAPAAALQAGPVRAVTPPVVVEIEPLAAFAEPEPQPVAKQLKARVVKRAAAALVTAPRAPKKVWVNPQPKAETPDPSEDRVIPAPCNHGEYRKLDEQRGVRLMCPGQL